MKELPSPLLRAYTYPNRLIIKLMYKKKLLPGTTADRKVEVAAG